MKQFQKMVHFTYNIVVFLSDDNALRNHDNSVNTIQHHVAGAHAYAVQCGPQQSTRKYS